MKSKNSHQFTLDILISPKPSLDNFVLSKKDRSNSVDIKSVLRSLVSYWENPSNNNPEIEIIYIWGPEGCGKTHLLKALASNAQENEISACFLESGSTLWSYLDYGNMLVHKIYFVDNVDHLSDNEQKAFFRLLIEAKEDENILIIATGTKSIAGLALRSDISSRLSSGLNFELHTLQDEEKIKALEEYAKAKSLNVPPEIFTWLLENFHRDMPSLIHVVEALDLYSLQNKRSITLPLVKDLLKNLK
jgi:DnaA-homolog protein